MADLHDVLERARGTAPDPRFALEDLRRRRARRDRVRRGQALIVGLAVAAAGIAVGVTALREPAPGPAAGDVAGALPAAWVDPPIARSGDYYYRAVLLAAEGCIGAPEDATCGSTGNRLDATFWWGPDDSGRIEVDARYGYGITEGRFGPGTYPNTQGVDADDFPLGTAELTAYLLERSSPGGASPAPLVTPPPGGGANDGQLWRAITDLLVDEHTTPALQASLLDVAASLEGSTVDLTASDPAGRDAYEIALPAGDGASVDRLYVDPATHGFLAWTIISNTNDAYWLWLVQQSGVIGSVEMAPDPEDAPFEHTLLSVDDLTRGFAQGDG